MGRVGLLFVLILKGAVGRDGSEGAGERGGGRGAEPGRLGRGRERKLSFRHETHTPTHLGVGSGPNGEGRDSGIGEQ